MVEADKPTKAPQSALTDAKPQGTIPAQSEPRHEKIEFSFRVIGIAAACLLAVAITAHLALWWLMRAFQAVPTRADAQLSPLARLPQTPPPPRLELQPPSDQAVYHQAQGAELNAYGWLDRPNGIVHIPIERAKTLVLQQGLPRDHAPGGK